MTLEIARVYDEPETGTTRVLVDRLWPRGLAKADATFSEWMKDVAPSSELRKWYGHRPEVFAEFSSRYRAELEAGPAKEALEQLASMSRRTKLVLVTATKDLDHSGAAVLRDLLAGKGPTKR